MNQASETADAASSLAEKLFSAEMVVPLLQGALVLALGLVIASLARRALGRMTAHRLSKQQSMIAGRALYWGVLGVVTIIALQKVGFDLSLLLGAAGVLTVALGFAAQTSTSNLISGLFLIGERSFLVGDVIRVSGITGEVLSIDLLSVKLRTFDNLFVRVPNENLLKSEITNLTRFDIRRLDLTIGVAYGENVAEVEDLLRAVAARNPLCLDEPRPLFLVTGFGASSIDLQFSPWCARVNFLEFKSAIQREIKEAFDEAGIEIPFPHRSLYAGRDSEPFAVRLVGDGPSSRTGGESAGSDDGPRAEQPLADGEEDAPAREAAEDAQDR